MRSRGATVKFATQQADRLLPSSSSSAVEHLSNTTLEEKCVARNEEVAGSIPVWGTSSHNPWLIERKDSNVHIGSELQAVTQSTRKPRRRPQRSYAQRQRTPRARRSAPSRRARQGQPEDLTSPRRVTAVARGYSSVVEQTIQNR